MSPRFRGSTAALRCRERSPLPCLHCLATVGALCHKKKEANMLPLRKLSCVLLLVLLLFGGASCRHGCPFASPDAPAALAVPQALPAAKAAVMAYYEQGDYEREVAEIMMRATALLPATALQDGKRLAVVLDIDETALSSYEYQKGMGFGHYGKAWHQWIELRRATAIAPVLAFYRVAQARGFAMFLVSGRREKSRAATEDNLRQVGYDGWERLYLKADNHREPSVRPFKQACRQEIEASGYVIWLNVGDQRSDLDGGFSRHEIELPNLIYMVE
jgi:hypothetical protein